MRSEAQMSAPPEASPALGRTDLPLPLLRRGKVRDVYDLGDALLLVATDRVSAFDVVLPQPVPHKGEVLTLLSAWWFAQIGELVPHHLIAAAPDRIAALRPDLKASRGTWARRALLVRKLAPLPAECVVRGYLSGSAWKEYARTGTLAGERLPEGLRESDRLDPPRFSPATKADEGHDRNITFSELEQIVGAATAGRLRELSLGLYERGRDIAAERGIILADTKFEFGREPDGTLCLIDEIFTPDSSRFWPADRYARGRGQPSLDKQPLRDYLEKLVHRGEWNGQPPGPDLPAEVVEATSRRYIEIFERLTGEPLDAFSFPEVDA